MTRITQHLGHRPRAVTALAMAAVAATLVLGSPLATASEAAVVAPQATVHYSVYELATDQGIRALYRRIVSAARSVCPGYDSQDLDAFVYSRQCQQQAVAHAVREIGNARLAAVHARTLRRHG